MSTNVEIANGTMIKLSNGQAANEKADVKRLHSSSSHASSGVSSADNSTRNGNPSRDSDSNNSRLGSMSSMDKDTIQTNATKDEGIDHKQVDTLPEGYAEDRFRVDRKRLEVLLSQSVKLSENTNATTLTRAEAFFMEVMNTTNTQVSWPSRLKVGAKSKKDPHIKITGPADQVKIAKDKIMQQLDSKSSRVTIKMDVSHTDHSHVIGKGGSNIKTVMTDTECHIHFPDSNRNSNVSEKSNQVSIAGQASGVELARQRIRELLPITLFFDFPTKHIGNLDLNSPAIQNIVKTYNISVQIKSRKPYTTVLQVRGCVSNQIGLKDGVVCLMQMLTGQLGQTIPISCAIEIQNVQSFMNAKSVAKIKNIQANTGITIDLPTSERKNQILEGITNNVERVVCMTGSCEGVLFARQEIISHLPLVLMFDLKEDVTATTAQQIGEKYECFISIKSKAKQATKSCIIKSSEANVYNMFKARQSLMNLSCNGLEDIPMPVNTASFMFNQKMQSVANYQMTMQKQVQQTFAPTWTNSKPVVQEQHKTNSPVIRRPLQISAKSINSMAQSGNPSTDSANSSKLNSVDSSSKASANTCNGIIRQPTGPPSNGSHYTARNSRDGSIVIEMSKRGVDSRGSMSSVDSCNTNTVGSPLKKSQDDCLSSGADCQSSDLSDSEISKNGNRKHAVISESYYKPITFRTSPPGFAANSNANLQNSGNVSCSTTSDNSDEQVTSNKKFSSGMQSKNNSNKMMMRQQAIRLPENINELFKCLNLEKYTESFLEQEIDIPTFLTMTDNDLRELGVNTFGARRKMTVAIRDLSCNNSSNHTSTANINLRICK